MLIKYQYDWYENVTRVENEGKHFILPGEVPIKLIHEHFDVIVLEVIKTEPPAWPAFPPYEYEYET